MTVDWKAIIDVLKVLAAGRPVVLLLIALLERFISSKRFDEDKAVAMLRAIEAKLTQE